MGLRGVQSNVYPSKTKAGKVSRQRAGTRAWFFWVFFGGRCARVQKPDSHGAGMINICYHPGAGSRWGHTSRSGAHGLASRGGASLAVNPQRYSGGIPRRSQGAPLLGLPWVVLGGIPQVYRGGTIIKFFFWRNDYNHYFCIFSRDCVVPRAPPSLLQLH